MDHSEISAESFHRLADRYRDKFMDLTCYDDSYQEFCDLLPRGRARVLDAACGPGNVARYLMKQRPDLDLLGIDLARRMVDFARAAVPSARFAVRDCRRLAELEMKFDGIICAFGLPYISPPEAAAFISAAGQSLRPHGVFYVSAMLGKSEDSGFVNFDTGERIFLNYHDEEHLKCSVQNGGLSLVSERRLPSPEAASKKTNDIILIAKKAEARGTRKRD